MGVRGGLAKVPVPNLLPPQGSKISSSKQQVPAVSHLQRRLICRGLEAELSLTQVYCFASQRESKAKCSDFNVRPHPYLARKHAPRTTIRHYDKT